VQAFGVQGLGFKVSSLQEERSVLGIQDVHD